MVERAGCICVKFNKRSQPRWEWPFGLKDCVACVSVELMSLCVYLYVYVWESAIEEDILSKAYEVFMVGVDVRQLNVDQKQNLGLEADINKR